MQAINKRQPETTGKRKLAGGVGEKKRKGRAESTTPKAPLDDRIQIEYTRETFELLAKLPKAAADCYQPEDDDL